MYVFKIAYSVFRFSAGPVYVFYYDTNLLQPKALCNRGKRVFLKIPEKGDFLGGCIFFEKEYYF